MERLIDLGKWTLDSLEDMLRKSSSFGSPAERIYHISKSFLGVDYKESTLIGDSQTPETFVINLRAVDCFTFIDYVEAMRLSRSLGEFEENLKLIRYRSGIVGFSSRNHFFTDWGEFNKAFIEDITRSLGGQKILVESKRLSLPGIELRERKIAYIPSASLDGRVIGKLETGDYIGVYSTVAGLDVSHVGIFIRTGKQEYLRHASSNKAQRKVVDHAFKKYFAAKPGIIVLRPVIYPRPDFR